MLRILTRLWSEDSSTPVSTETQSQRKEGTPKPRPTKQKATRTNPKQKGGEGGSVEKPDTSLARQFKHQGKSSSVKTKEGTGGTKKGEEQRGWKGVCTKDRGEEEVGSPDQSSIRTVRHRGRN